ncbi:MAG: FkbM family methyltransferase [Verrucomicrobiaceae bacterium]|nr:MAG: FkbM family methyltransferase [Verrucomicrobiaceae bacterium]
MKQLLTTPLRLIARLVGIDRTSREKLVRERIDQVISNIQHLQVEDPVIRSTDFAGVFTIDARSHLYSRFIIDGSYEPEVAKLLDRHLPRQRDVLDVGANIGLFSVKCASLLHANKVVAVEPTPNALGRLRKNIARNGFEARIEVFAGVASDKEGTVDINFIPGKEEYSTVGNLAHPSVAGLSTTSVKVEALPLDAIVSRYNIDPGFIKIDVEGMEHLVLVGASETLRTKRPIVMCELCDPLLQANGSSAAAILSVFSSADYTILNADNAAAVPGASSYGNIICFPKEMGISSAALP